MNKREIIRVILYILVIIWMVVIFMFSNMNRTKSNNTSKEVLYKIVSITNSKSSEVEKKKIVKKYNHYIRKLAHITEYFILTLLIYLALIYSDISINKSIIISIIISILYASLDEVHQLFIDGRGAQVSDVLIDSIGIFLSMFIVWVRNLIR